MKYLVVLVIAVIAGVALRPAVSYLSKSRSQAGLTNGQLLACPEKPNCVSSQASNENQMIQPLVLSEFPGLSLDTIAALIRQQPGAQIVTLDTHYLHATYKSRMAGFVDDVEFLLQPDTGTIQVKSASRLGHSDLGVNRKRIEAVRAQLAP